MSLQHLAKSGAIAWSAAVSERKMGDNDVLQAADQLFKDGKMSQKPSRDSTPL